MTLATDPISTTGSDAARRNLLIGYAFAALGAVLFSSKAISAKLIFEHGIDVETLMALRMLLSLPVYLVIGAISVRERFATGRSLPSTGLLWKACLIGLVGYWLSSYLDFWGLQTISAQFERLILFTYPVFVVIFGALFFGNKFEKRAFLAFGVAYFGLAVIFLETTARLGNGIIFGAGLVFLAAMSFAFYQLVAKNLIGQIGPRLFTCVAMTSASVTTLVFFAFTNPLSDLLVDRTVFLHAIYLALGATVAPSFLMTAALNRISAQSNATIGIISPVITLLFAVAFLGETITWADIIGTILVIGGIGWFTLGGKKA